MSKLSLMSNIAIIVISLVGAIYNTLIANSYYLIFIWLMALIILFSRLEIIARANQ